MKLIILIGEIISEMLILKMNKMIDINYLLINPCFLIFENSFPQSETHTSWKSLKEAAGVKTSSRPITCRQEHILTKWTMFRVMTFLSNVDNELERNVVISVICYII